MFKLFTLMALLVLASGVMMADNTIIIHKQPNGTCGMVGSDASGNAIFGGLGNVQLIVDNAGGKLQLTCKGSNIENDSGKGQHFTGFLCGVVDPDGGVLITTDSDATVSASGQASLTCRVPAE